ncbi:MAG: helix-turn-helix transcriptional regulator [Clostridia bacterium]|nr:helix-turn-helix transcriptional regulator [Clostridia bacterium]
MQIKLGEQIKALRRRDGRTQEDLANALGVTAQAVSRWEKGICYPDMELMPSMANYFGVAIDLLFGYDSGREQKINTLAEQITAKNRENNGVDVCMDECIRMAREALIEFPGNERLMYCLASVLYNAGYVRYGEFHLIDEEGFNVYDVKRHLEYTEWQEAIKLYEKLLTTLQEGELRHKAVTELTQLYLNTGEHEKALAIAEAAPDIGGSKPFLKINARDGREKAKACSEALLETADAFAGLIITTVLSYEQNMTPGEKAQSLQNAIRVFDLVCTGGVCGRYHAYIARIYTLLSLYLWMDGQREETFEALDSALEHGRKYEALCGKENVSYRAPLLRLTAISGCQKPLDYSLCESLAEDWPWWSVQEYNLVAKEIQTDPRWTAWVEKTKG